MTIGEMIRNQRKEKNMTQQELGDLLGVSSQMIAQYENDKRNPKIETLKKICSAMNITITDLGDDIWNYYSAKERAEYFFSNTFNTTFSKLPSQIETLTKNTFQEIKEKLIVSGNLTAQQAHKILDSDFKCVFILHDYDKLNEAGQIEAVKRVKELSKIPEYQKSSAPKSKIIVLPYFRAGVSAGSGIFILGNEAEDEIELPDLPEYEAADFAIDVNGNSMEPDFLNGDIALVQSDAEMFPGDVGIFVIDSNAFIKELGEKELISRNKDYKNIPIHEGDNVVCMGKVIGKVKTDEE